jgi:hypothetical protein
LYNFPQGAAEQAPMFGAICKAWQYFVLIRWHSTQLRGIGTGHLCVVLFFPELAPDKQAHGSRLSENPPPFVFLSRV